MLCPNFQRHPFLNHTAWSIGIEDYLCDLIRQTGFSDEAAGLFLGVAPCHLQRWAQERPEFRLSLLQARQEFRYGILQKLLRAADDPERNHWRIHAWLLEHFLPVSSSSSSSILPPRPEAQIQSCKDVPPLLPKSPAHPRWPELHNSQTPSPGHPNSVPSPPPHPHCETSDVQNSRNPPKFKNSGRGVPPLFPKSPANSRRPGLHNSQKTSPQPNTPLLSAPPCPPCAQCATSPVQNSQNPPELKQTGRRIPPVIVAFRTNYPESALHNSQNPSPQPNAPLLSAPPCPPCAQCVHHGE